MLDVKQPIRVMIVDDHEIVRRGLASYLEGSDDFLLVASVNSGEEAIRVCPHVLPDIVLMDLRMKDLDGIETTRRIKATYPNTRVVVLTGVIEYDLINEIFAAGAVGYILKNRPMSDLQHLLRTVYDGQMTLAPEVTEMLLRSAGTGKKANVYNLTEREFDVLRLLVEGCNNPEIAEKLFITRSTVGFHVSSIIGKLGVSNRMEAAYIAHKENLVSSETGPVTRNLQ